MGISLVIILVDMVVQFLVENMAFLVGDFINNYSDCNAGAIHGTQVDYIYGDFIGNHAVGAPGTFGGLGGGAISEVTGTIYGNFCWQLPCSRVWRSYSYSCSQR